MGTGPHRKSQRAWWGGGQPPPRPHPSPLPPSADARLQACHAAGRRGARAGGGWQRLSRQCGGEFCPSPSILPLPVLPGPPPRPQPEPAHSRVVSGSRAGSQASPGCPQGCAGRQPKCGRDCAQAIVLPCGCRGCQQPLPAHRGWCPGYPRRDAPVPTSSRSQARHRGAVGEGRGSVEVRSPPRCDGGSCFCPGGVSEGAGTAAEPPGLAQPAGAGALRRRRLPGAAARRRRRHPGHPVPQR